MRRSWSLKFWSFMENYIGSQDIPSIYVLIHISVRFNVVIWNSLFLQKHFFFPSHNFTNIIFSLCTLRGAKGSDWRRIIIAADSGTSLQRRDHRPKLRREVLFGDDGGKSTGPSKFRVRPFPCWGRWRAVSGIGVSGLEARRGTRCTNLVSEVKRSVSTLEGCHLGSGPRTPGDPGLSLSPRSESIPGGEREVDRTLLPLVRSYSVVVVVVVPGPPQTRVVSPPPDANPPGPVSWVESMKDRCFNPLVVDGRDSKLKR